MNFCAASKMWFYHCYHLKSYWRSAIKPTVDYADWIRLVHWMSASNLTNYYYFDDRLNFLLFVIRLKQIYLQLLKSAGSLLNLITIVRYLIMMGRKVSLYLKAFSWLANCWAITLIFILSTLVTLQRHLDHYCPCD